ncbi:unnamed protein product [Amaranthus hypochondriacus]
MASTLSALDSPCKFFVYRNPNYLITQSKQCIPLSIKTKFRSILFLAKRFLNPEFTVNGKSNLLYSRTCISVACSYKSDNEARDNAQQKGSKSTWPILERWDVPWPWQTISLTSLACGIRQFCGDRID